MVPCIVLQDDGRRPPRIQTAFQKTPLVLLEKRKDIKMNLATGSMTFGRNHRFVFGSLIAALSAAVILAGVAVWQFAGTDSSATAVEPVAAPAAVPAVDTTSRSITPTFYYLVGSQAQGEMILRADYENQTYGGTATEIDHTSYVIDISTPEGQQQAWLINGELQQLMLDNPGFDAGLVQIYDLTAGAGLANTSGRSSFVPTDVPAGSKLYIVASEAEKQALLHEADEAAFWEEITYVAPTVMVIDPLDQEFLQLMVSDQIGFGTFDIVDLR